MNDITQDPLFYYAVSLAFFLALFLWKGRKPLLNWLDSEIIKIAAELEQATTLRAEAEAMLAEGKKRQAAADAEIDGIIRHGRSEAERLRQHAEENMRDMLTKHEQQMIERIRIAESEAVDSIRVAVIDRAFDIARKTLGQQVDQAAASRMVTHTLENMPSLSPAKAKAA